MSYFDTIVAPITGSGPAAVAIVRLSGPEAWGVCERVFGAWPDDPVPRLAIYGRYSTGDDGLILPFEEGHSYTGEPAVEMSLHGSPASVRALVEACLAAGARIARPGEFTERAFLNGRLDLTQAEAVRDTVEAQTDAQLRLANLHREGALHREVTALREEALSLLAAVEASVDFSDEVGELDRPLALSRLESLSARLDGLLATAESGRIMRQGLRIAIVGPPNAGKSSLLNALLGHDRSIVTEIPGTTRDYVEESADLGGVPCVLIDTAGLRETEERIEAIGVERSRLIAENADLVWYVVDGSAGTGPPPPPGAWTLLNKCDLVPESARTAAGCERGMASLFWISALTGEGLPELIAAVRGLAQLDGDIGPRIAPRHGPLLGRAREAIEGVRATLSNPIPDDLASVGLHEAIRALGEVTGESASPDIIEQIFRDFCIGK